MQNKKTDGEAQESNSLFYRGAEILTNENVRGKNAKMKKKYTDKEWRTEFS